ncbi:GntR family transcriptional regulator [Microbacterium sp. 1.5R]|uniref:GntR family transcriptional regulator n=1 Tax=Microbacterium sp. 1.5R TaxID=1916917 RepID=UPI0011A06CF5|nr:GntR family transcriptional regulator [Microbacterium sp. 1.5R]
MSDVATADRVYHLLQREIVRGDLPPGARLVEAELAERLDVSRTPVREALHRLRADGLAVARGKRGVEVLGWSEREIEDAQRLRAQVESWAGRLATQRLEPTVLSKLRVLSRAMLDEWESDAADLDRVAELNIQFHGLINEAADSPAVDQLLARATHLPLLHRVFHSYSPAETQTALNEHETIIRALEWGDPEWVEATIKGHILAALPALLAPDHSPIASRISTHTAAR